jgi:hypothetical protein
LLVACGPTPKPIFYEPLGPEAPEVEAPAEGAPTTTAPRSTVKPRDRMDYASQDAPMTLAVTGERLVWSDALGSIWTVPITGGTAKRLATQHTTGFAFHPVNVGGEVLVSTKKDFVRVTLPDGPVTAVGVKLPETPEEVVADDRAIYVTLFKRDEIYAIPARGGAPKQLATLRRGVLAVHAGTLYAISYVTGELVAIPTGGGAQRSVAKGFVRPTALAADDTHAFIYTERDKTLSKVELRTGTTSKLADSLENSDDLVSDGAYLYTFSWPAKLVRITKASGKVDVLADDLASPYHIVTTADHVYVTSRDQKKIVRVKK